MHKCATADDTLDTHLITVGATAAVSHLCVNGIKNTETWHRTHTQTRKKNYAR